MLFACGGRAARLTIRFTDSSRHSVPRRVRCPWLFKCCRDAPKGVAPATEVRDLRPRGLFCRVRFNMSLVRGQSVAELDVADALPVAAFVPQCIAGPLRDFFESLGLSF